MPRCQGERTANRGCGGAPGLEALDGEGGGCGGGQVLRMGAAARRGEGWGRGLLLLLRLAQGDREGGGNGLLVAPGCWQGCARPGFAQGGRGRGSDVCCGNMEGDGLDQWAADPPPEERATNRGKGGSGMCLMGVRQPSRREGRLELVIGEKD